MNQQLNIQRMYYLGRRDMITRWRNLAVCAGLVSGAMLLVAMLHLFFSGRVDIDYVTYFLGTLLIWGSIDASMAFASMQAKPSNEVFLLLPASALEKMLVRLLFTSVVLPLAILLLVFTASLLSEGMSVLLTDNPFAPLRLFGAGRFKWIGYLIVWQSLLFLGATWFKKAHLIKTILSLIVLAVGFGIISAILFRIMFASALEGLFWSGHMGFNMDFFLDQGHIGLMRTLRLIHRILFYGLLAPFCWFVAWLRIKETQSSDGI